MTENLLEERGTVSTLPLRLSFFEDLAGNAIGSMFLIKLFLSNLLLHLALNPGKNQVPYSPLHERLRTYV